jgi:CubicO group peptidase (beta-lactamase class C family)
VIKPLFALMLLWTGAVEPGGVGLPSKTPAAVGMSATRLEAIDHIMSRAIRAGGFPGGVVIVGRRGATVLEKGYGNLGWSDKTKVVAERTIYDLASLTKVVATTTALMILYDQGKIQLDEPVSTYLPAFHGGAKDDITVRLLLEHRSGLPADRDFWRTSFTPEDTRQAEFATPLECAPGSCYIYSDIGADILGFVVEALSGQRLDAFLQTQVYGPLNMEDTGFKPHWTLRDRIAPTELSPPRGYPLRGEVHDENAFALGGVAGHAGLFSTASDLAVFAQMMLNGGELNGVRIVADSTVALFTARTSATDTRNTRDTRALGWDTCGKDNACGKQLSPRAFGHTGFTGTSLWIDPDRDMFVILLTNRVHAARARRPSKVISDIRMDVQDVAALAVRDYGPGMRSMPASFRADRASGWNRPIRSRKVRSRSSTSGKAQAKPAPAATPKKSALVKPPVVAKSTTRPGDGLR